jgi:hypothetical protein
MIKVAKALLVRIFHPSGRLNMVAHFVAAIPTVSLPALKIQMALSSVDSVSRYVLGLRQAGQDHNLAACGLGHVRV